MKIEKTLLDDHQVQLSVEVDEETFDVSKRKAAKKISRKTKIPGFRPGNAPYQVIVRHFGEGAIIEEAIEFLVDDIYPKLLETEEITPYGPGQLKEVKNLTPPELEFVIPLAPEVVLGDYQAIRMEYSVPEITEEDVDQTVENLRSRQAKTEPVDRPSEAGDMMVVTVHATDKAEGEDAPLIVDLHDTPLVVEADDADTEKEWPFPGFSNGLKGLAKGAEAEFEHTYPEDYDQDDNLKGKDVVFKVTVQEVRSRDVPELTDEFAQSIGEYETVADLREDARRHLEASSAETYESDFENRLLDAIVTSSTFSFPPQMVEDEIDSLVENFKSRLANEGWDLDTYLKANQKDMDALRAEFQETAQRRIRRGLVMMEVAEREGVQVSERDVQLDVQRTVDMVNTSFPAKESRKILTQDFLRGLVSSAMRDALTARTFARLKAIAKGEDDQAEEAPAENEAVETPEAAVEAAAAEEPAVEEAPEEETE